VVSILGEKVTCVTIADSSYFPQVLVLAKSFREHHINSNFYLLCLDGFREICEIDSNIQSLNINELGIPKETLDEMYQYYDVVELATALKPWAILKLLEMHNNVVIYLDPDILVISSLEKAIMSAHENGSVLTPARIELIDSVTTDRDELALMRYGSFNLGFIACTSAATEILLWWRNRLIWYAGRGKFHFHFTDQKWMDVVLSRKRVGVIRDFGFNVTSVNLSERNLSYRQGCIYANEDLLVFVHFIQSSERLKSGIKSSKKIELNEDLSSAEIYHKITQDYINLLSEASKSTKCINLKGYQAKYKSVLVREFLRRKSMRRVLKNEPARNFRFSWILIIVSYFLFPFEKSFAFQFAVSGLIDDLARFRKRAYNSDSSRYRS
jgi:lipopolysaccharide biosynthesis glycosyltransferase